MKNDGTNDAKIYITYCTYILHSIIFTSSKHILKPQTVRSDFKETPQFELSHFFYFWFT